MSLDIAKYSLGILSLVENHWAREKSFWKKNHCMETFYVNEFKKFFKYFFISKLLQKQVTTFYPKDLM